MSDAVTLTTDEPELFPAARTKPEIRASVEGRGAGKARKAKARRSLSGVLLPILFAVLFLWGAWVTKTLIDLGADKAPFAAVRLQPLVEEYVQAQARTNTPEEQVTRETQAFMSALDAELRARGEEGRTIIVAEAVLSKNVPDITDEVRKAVYAKVPAPGGVAAASPALGGVSGGLGR